MDPALMTIAALAPQIADRSISPVEITQSILRQIKKYDPLLRVYITVLEEEALEAAKTAEQQICAGQYLGPLHGIPVSLKDLFATAGIPTTSGSKINKNYIPSFDATVVQKLKQAGAIILGKTNMHEFACSVTNNNPHFGATRNPWNQELIPGGSSGGSAVAVAANLCIASLGSDTGGSVQIPSACCGIVGLKPTYGRISKYGVTALSWSLDHVGSLTKTVRDAAIILTILAGADPLDPVSLTDPVPDYALCLENKIKGLKVGIPSNYYYENVDNGITTLLNQAIYTYKQLGATLLEISLPNLIHAHDCEFLITLAEAGTCHWKTIREQPTELGEDVRLFLQQGNMCWLHIILKHNK
jgi:aspartyl-tRNA(Asn)/glutamyl-tRNA(Gln) amidotransferase subunit A